MCLRYQDVSKGGRASRAQASLSFSYRNFFRFRFLSFVTSLLAVSPLLLVYTCIYLVQSVLHARWLGEEKDWKPRVVNFGAFSQLFNLRSSHSPCSSIRGTATTVIDKFYMALRTRPSFQSFRRSFWLDETLVASRYGWFLAMIYAWWLWWRAPTQIETLRDSKSEIWERTLSTPQ